jgi:hypothetical protein
MACTKLTVKFTLAEVEQALKDCARSILLKPTNKDHTVLVLGFAESTATVKVSGACVLDDLQAKAREQVGQQKSSGTCHRYFTFAEPLTSESKGLVDGAVIEFDYVVK